MTTRLLPRKVTAQASGLGQGHLWGDPSLPTTSQDLSSHPTKPPLCKTPSEPSMTTQLLHFTRPRVCVKEKQGANRLSPRPGNPQPLVPRDANTSHRRTTSTGKHLGLGHSHTLREGPTCYFCGGHALKPGKWVRPQGELGRPSPRPAQLAWVTVSRIPGSIMSVVSLSLTLIG